MKLKVKQFMAPAASQMSLSVKSSKECVNMVKTDPVRGTTKKETIQYSNRRFPLKSTSMSRIIFVKRTLLLAANDGREDKCFGNFGRRLLRQKAKIVQKHWILLCSWKQHFRKSLAVLLLYP